MASVCPWTYMYESVAYLTLPSLVNLRFSSMLGYEIKSWFSMYMLDPMTLVASDSIGTPIPIICCNLGVLSWSHLG